MTAEDLLRLTSKPSASPVAGMMAQSADFLTLLQAQEEDGRVALYGSARHGTTSFLVHSVRVKTEKLSGDLSRIVDWEGNPYDHPGCALVTYGGKGFCVEMTDPWIERQPEPLLGAIQLVFGRSFDGILRDSSIDCRSLAKSIAQPCLFSSLLLRSYSFHDYALRLRGLSSFVPYATRPASEASANFRSALRSNLSAAGDVADGSVLPLRRTWKGSRSLPLSLTPPPLSNSVR